MAKRRAVGRPRRPEVDDRILDATVDLLTATGYESLTIEGVAAAADVAKTTVYRRWSSKPDLVVAAVDRLTEDLPADDLGSLRADLLALVEDLLRRFRDRRFSAVIRAMQQAVLDQPGLQAAAASGFLADRRRRLDAIVDRAIVRGELAPGVDRELVFDLVVGALFMRLAVMRLPVPPGHADRLVDAVLLGYPAATPTHSAE